MLQRAWKPWYVYRPRQLARRVLALFRDPPAGHQPVYAAWGAPVFVNPAEHVGRCLWTTGVYDLAVSEIILRLTRTGDLTVDAGAHVGYMTLLAATASGPAGTVIAFEPNPQSFRWLQRNADECRRHFDIAQIELRPTALGSRNHMATLLIPGSDAANDGLARITREDTAIAGGGHTTQVIVERLDDVLGERRVGLMKLDVEGYESHVLRGCVEAIAAKRIRDIVFEDHHASDSEPAAILEAAGYEIFALGWSLRGPMLCPREHRASAPYEAPSYLATREPDAARRACAPRGWQALRRQTRPARV